MGERRRLVWETYGDLGIARSREVTTPEAVLAEMGAERVWVCRVHGLIDPKDYIVGEFNQEWCKPLHQGRGCGYYQIVKVADDAAS